ncbi:DUF6653 family protein [Halobaculum lipolyticum]|uniref:DUF6653 family protein n=1 Tax=Halobaculum lipolyticum TaxID=3032001 RepID=A0ABD5WB17_9EURY|nr:DUF6653 family protein [Halobaculum sp. DT31]
MSPLRPGIDGELLWRRHENPVSVWWFVLLYPVFVLAIYRRSLSLGGVVVCSLAANALAVPPPNTDDAWATRVVRGERAWLDRGVFTAPVDLACVAVGGVVNLWTLRAAVNRRPVATVVGSVASLALMFLFFDRMAAHYDATTDFRA